MSLKNVFLKFALPVLVLAAGGAGAAALFASRESPEREETPEKAVLVDVERAEMKAHRLDVRASGTVTPARNTQLTPQVSGELVEVSPQFEPGGIVEKGEVLARVDPSDYEVALRQQKAALEQARAQLELEKGQQDVAKQEWELFKEEAKARTDVDEQSALALREPQLASARAQVESAKSAVERARLNLQRTTIRAPFDGVVVEEAADVGQVVGGQSRLGRIVGTAKFWVRLSVDTSKIPHVDIPGVNAEKGSSAEIFYDVGERTVERSGRVSRLLGDLAPSGRMARLLIEIDDPLGRQSAEDDEQRGLPLLLDAYVDVRIEGNEERELVELSRKALRNGDEVFVYADETLDIREVDVVWGRPNTVLIGSGLEDGDRVVLSQLPQPVEGMRLTLSDSNDDGEAEASAGEASDGEGGGGE